MPEEYTKSGMRDTLESLVVTVILAIFGTTFVVQAFKIPTGSMEDTLLIGDHLLVNKFVFAYHHNSLGGLLPYRSVRNNDVIVFKYPYEDPSQEPGEHLVKRVIGIPGDRIKLVNRQVFVNGKPVAEPFDNFGNPPDPPEAVDNFPPPEAEIPMYRLTERWTSEIENYIVNGELVVPPGLYFVMGDHRERSWDSRYWGFVPRDIVSGRPLVIYWSFKTPEDEYMRNSVPDRLEQTAALIIHFFDRTRWRRTLNLVH